VLTYSTLTQAAMHLGKRTPPLHHHTLHFRAEKQQQENPWAAGNPLAMQDHARAACRRFPENPEGAALVRVRLGSDPAAFSLKRRL